MILTENSREQNNSLGLYFVAGFTQKSHKQLTCHELKSGNLNRLAQSGWKPGCGRCLEKSKADSIADLDFDIAYFIYRLSYRN